MPAKRPTPITREQLVDNIHAAVRAYIEAGNGKAMIIGPIEIVQHKAMQFDVVVKCVGEMPKWGS